MLGVQNLKNHALVSRFFAVLSIDILVKASGFVLLPFFLRLMSQNEFGLYNYILSIIQTFSLVLNLGLYIPQSRLYHTYESQTQKGQLLFTIYITLLAVSVVFCSIIFLSGLDDWLIQKLFDSSIKYQSYKSLIIIALIVSVFTFMLTNYFYTTEKIKQVKAYNVGRIILVNGGSLLALFLIRGNPVAIRLSCTFGIELILFILFSGYLFRKMVAVFNRNMMLKSLKLGVPIMVSAIFGIVVNFSDKFLLQRYGSLADLSNYYLAFSFAAIIPLVFASLQNVWLPVFLQEKDVEKNFHKTTKLLVKLAWIFVSISIAIWLLFYILLWLKFIPGKYSDVTWILPILLITQIFASLTPIFSNYLVYFEKTSYVSLSGLIVSLVSISLGLWLIPLWGVLGAAITTLIINAIYLAIYYYLVLFLKSRYLTARQNFQS